jgi:acetyl esterase/lipase
MRFLLGLASVFAFAHFVTAQDAPHERIEDVIYGRKFGTALTLDVFKPKENANGAGVIFCVSGGFVSAKENINSAFMTPFTKRGYTVFAVVHGSQPKYTIPEILEDQHRAVRYIRHHAKTYGIDPDRLGITGGSAGGHLSLMQGCAPLPGNPEATDPVERESSRVAAVGCFFPPTDFLNYGKEGNVALGRGSLTGFKAPFDFMKYNKQTRSFDPVTDEDERKAIGKAISPATHVSKDSVPTLLIHGDADTLVPLQQSEWIISKFQEHKVPNKLIVKPKAGHGWAGMDKDLEEIIAWFDLHAAKK